MAAQVGRVPRHYDHVPGSDGDLLLAARAHVGLTCLGGVDAPDVEAQVLARSSQVCDLLQLFQLEGRALGLLAPPTAPWGGAGHASQATERETGASGWACRDLAVTGPC